MRRQRKRDAVKIMIFRGKVLTNVTQCVTSRAMKSKTVSADERRDCTLTLRVERRLRDALDGIARRRGIKLAQVHREMLMSRLMLRRPRVGDSARAVLSGEKQSQKGG
jgi:hypothetical protein